MKNNLKRMLALSLVVVSLSYAAHDGAMTSKDGVMMKDGKMMLTKNGQTMAMSDDMRMSNGSQVMRDGNVIRADGQKRTLTEGESMGMDGARMKSGNHLGMAGMTTDCVMMKDGKMMVVRNGQTTAMEKDIKMPNGTQVMKNGNVMTADGRKTMTKNGEAMAMDGTMMTAGNQLGMTGMITDGFMMKDGKMLVMKNGKSSVMKKEMKMKDGTKVMADGTVITKDGRKTMLGNGDSISRDGKMMKNAK